MLKLLHFLENQTSVTRQLIAYSLIGVTGLIDFITGDEIGFSVFYLLPIVMVTWYEGRASGIIISLVSATVWLFADIGWGKVYSHPLIPVWNSVIRFAFFIIITLLLSELGKAIERERQLARTDNLTGVINSRAFYELLSVEVERLQRYNHPFTLAYIDLDNFKLVNDTLGHSTGDKVLCTVTSQIQSRLRKIDILARLGGDEFVVLLPETDSEAANRVIHTMKVEMLEEMRSHNWPITFSIGVLTCHAAPSSMDELVTLADTLMYNAKHHGKNAIRSSVYPEDYHSASTGLQALS